MRGTKEEGYFTKWKWWTARSFSGVRYNSIVYYVYILESKQDHSRYIGTTSDLRNRFKEHNCGETKSNKSKRPFKIAWYCVFGNKSVAYAFERYLKSSSGYAFSNKHLLL